METQQNEYPPKRPANKRFLLGILIFAIAFAATFATVFRIWGSVSYARELSRRAVCKTRLKGLGTAFELYAQVEGDGNTFPPNLDVLVTEGYCSEKNFVCPVADRMASVSVSPRDYVYCLCSQPTDSTPGALLMMYELPINHYQGMANLLFRAGHVSECDNMDEYRKYIQAVNDFLASKGGTKP